MANNTWNYHFKNNTCYIIIIINNYNETWAYQHKENTSPLNNMTINIIPVAPPPPPMYNTQRTINWTQKNENEQLTLHLWKILRNSTEVLRKNGEQRGHFLSMGELDGRLYINVNRNR